MYYCASENNVNEEIRNNERYKLIKGNLCSYDLASYIINDYKIDYIIHFAAQSHVQNSFEDSLQYTKDNIQGTYTLLEVCRKYNKIKKFIHVSTDEVYGESMIDEDENKKTENSILCPTNPYAATKGGAELIAQSYYHSFKIPFIDLNKLYSWTTNNSANYASVLEGYQKILFGSGCGFFLSNEAVNYLINFENIDYYKYFEDVAIGEIIYPKYSLFIVNRINFTDFDNKEITNDEIKNSDTFHYRCKNENDMHKTTYNLEKMYELIYKK
jgi:hypothetical protein